ncbi:MAG: 6-phosphofructokinase [Bacteroidales bacterium]|jgi:ATP-dependent phosphofructokinase / diphosphate-dependent phosphofructokinase|nr:6-phosphofructokinase [Lentimicrobiaceae bacterium]MDG1136376.1 6-phosphofructokinase [Bacteroidales bacterium]MDG1901124.1 6-phosphofructokinase [Bacteroidales bacterium]MDG2080546.1 6-phosphofructokinase [Bacteroidales bacterium]|tara:strand:+ start:7308 stop:8525 length:1218 start_codon:yes stop_codon:yes gene_type:complete
MKESIAILCGGGPAPGINSVISSVSLVFLRSGYEVIGIHEGYKGLFSDDPNTIDIDFNFADDIHKQGGSALQMSRHKPKANEFSTKFFMDHNVKLLVTIGGDDTASTANRISKYLKSNDVNIQNIHVPKTIDNDLPLPPGIPTFGYHSAKQEGVRISQTIYEDARTSGNWFVLSAMGREAGHLAFGIGAACHFPMIIIPEMFDKVEVTFDKIINLVISAIVKRKIEGVDYGVAIISEGVFHFMSDEEIKNSGINFSYDDHGHPELGNVSKAHIFNVLLQDKLTEMGLNVKSRPVELGYELRCVQPTAYDLMYCGMLGFGVKKLFDEGRTGCMVTANPVGEINPLYLDDVADESGKVQPRLVDINGDKAKMVYNQGLQFVEPGDYESAKKFVTNPQELDFRAILGW